MKRLHRAVRQKRIGGRPMPPVFRQVTGEPWKAHIRRSEVTMIAGQPGAGKSLIALWHALKWTTEHDLRGIYLSADSAELGQAARALAMKVMGVSVSEAERLLSTGDQWAIDQMKDLNALSWSFEDDLSYDNIAEEVDAFIELWGTTPDFIIVDNLTDVEGQSEDEWATLRRALKALVQLARSTDAAVVVLHHTSEDDRIKEEPCPPRRAIQGKCAQKPAVIYTTSDQGLRRPLAVVKNRFGHADKTGRSAVWMNLDEETMHFREI